jgi:curli biogenesis system outer membrane secretion channel CsgG
MKAFLNNTALNLSLTTALLTGMLLPAIAIAQTTESNTVIAQSQTSQKKRVAVLNFSATGFGSNAYYQGESQGMSDLIVNQLVSGGTYEVIERSRLQQVIDEQKLSNSDLANPATAAKIGQLLGVEAVLIGNVTQFNVDVDRQDHNYPFVRKTQVKSTATVELTARLVSTQTGTILDSYTWTGEDVDKQTCTIIAGMGSCNTTDNNTKILRKAAALAINKMVSAVNQGAGKLSSSLSIPAPSPKNSNPSETVIADITDGQITLNKGSEAGVKQGMRVSVERMGRPITDPNTGKVIRVVTSTIGKLEITEVGQGYSIAKILSGTGFKSGDIAKSTK